MGKRLRRTARPSRTSPSTKAAGDFFGRVYALVRRIPRGRVATYGQIAALLSHPRAARTVGWALRALPEDSGVPWHRVINGRGRISTGGRAHEASLQAELLRREGVGVGAGGAVPLNRFLWNGGAARQPREPGGKRRIRR